jgi:hypothetical protein
VVTKASIVGGASTVSICAVDASPGEAAVSEGEPACAARKNTVAVREPVGIEAVVVERAHSESLKKATPKVGVENVTVVGAVTEVGWLSMLRVSTVSG